MNDCLWFAMGVCNGECKCKQYLSMNSDKGYKICYEWENKVDEILKPKAIIFAEENGFINQ